MAEGNLSSLFRVKEFGTYKKMYNLNEYLKRYMEWPQLEMFSKMGLYGVVEKMVDGYIGTVVQDTNAKRPEEFLGIRKERVKDLAAVEGDAEYLRVWKMEKRYNQNWTWQQSILIRGCNIECDSIEIILEYTTMKKFFEQNGILLWCEDSSKPFRGKKSYVHAQGPACGIP